MIDVLHKLHDVARQRHPKVFNRHFYPKRRKIRFDFEAKRRREIVLHGRLVGASDNHLIAWVWHNSTGRDPIWSLQNAALSMGRKISEAEASEIVYRAMNGEVFKRRAADSLALFLSLTWDVRRKLRITTIGSTDVRRRDREEIRKVRDKVRKREHRRANGVQPRSEYLLKSLSRTQPWKVLGISRRTWERERRQQAFRLRNREDLTVFAVTSTPPPSLHVATPSAAITKLAADGLATRPADTLASTKPTTPDVPRWQPRGETPAVKRFVERRNAWVSQ